MEDIFVDISIVLFAATILAAIAKWLRQPTIPAYILAGVLLGPSVFGVIQRGELLTTLSHFGIAFLLFLVGIRLDLRAFFKRGRLGILLGIAQMAFAVIVGYLITRLLGFPPTPALFLSIALGFSSTIIILKILSERKELNTLYGQIVIGLMLTQDFIAVLFLIFFDLFTGSQSGIALVNSFLFTFLKGVFLFSLALLASRYLLTAVFRYFARSVELLFLGAICWCLLFSLIAMWLGFSIEVGALLAGVSLSFLPYHIEIGHRISSLRDFFLPIFFAVLGGQLVFTNVSNFLTPTIVLSLFVLFGSSILVAGLMFAFGYRARISFQTGLAIGQVSEFSFVFVNLGFAAGIIDQTIVAFVALIGLVTMTLSTYLMEYSDRLYTVFQPILKQCERKNRLKQMERLPKQLRHHVILFGYHTMGYKIRHLVEELGKPLIVIDHSPAVIQELEKEKVHHIYGSIGDEEIFERANLAQADVVISTVPSHGGTLALLDYVRENHLPVQTIVVGFQIDDALEYYHHGASFVLHPTSISAHYLQKLFGQDVERRRQQHIKELETLQKLQ